MQGSKCLKNVQLHSLKGSLRDIVTESDILAEAEIKQFLALHYPFDRFVGEESNQATVSNKYWICDPIDGTANFVAGQSYYCCALAYMDNNKPIVGVVHAPKLNKLYWASINYGAYVNASRLLPRSIQLCDTLIAVSIPSKTSEGLFKKIEKLNKISRGVLRLGSANLNILQVCENTLGLALGFQAPKWDIEPALAIAKISGVNTLLYENADGTCNYVVTKTEITDEIKSFLYD
jgi:myo-inositol-1(or 4)-monophosphatase